MKIFGRPHDYERALADAARLLARLDEATANQAFLTGPTATLADVAVYSYVAKAPEGGVDLTAYPYVRAWLRRVEALPSFLAMPDAGGD